ncbi:MAG TPA: DUF192 domain-containing protein [Brevundimonas sp.]|jgi:uncharacterized membrane protein (UPF0127 family)|uniref:DUF192 domain-containing protein n=1 Tax=Brevundimonas sp. TaxID=1871086 RepID=UPI002DF4C36A|nr:DUF192 domain-containing protein [Brevundimonas sp.]
MFDRRLVLTAALVTALGACAGDAAGPKDQDGNPLEKLTVVTTSGEHQFWVEIADDEAERQRGLMFRQPLADDRGMLFEFPEAAERGFWMSNTPSSLDIVYIGADGRIVSIAKHTTPYSESTYPSNGPAKGVLETRAGRMDEIGAKPGDRVVHPFFGG